LVINNVNVDKFEKYISNSKDNNFNLLVDYFLFFISSFFTSDGASSLEKSFSLNSYVSVFPHTILSFLNFNSSPNTDNSKYYFSDKNNDTLADDMKIPFARIRKKKSKIIMKAICQILYHNNPEIIKGNSIFLSGESFSKFGSSASFTDIQQLQSNTSSLSNIKNIFSLESGVDYYGILHPVQKHLFSLLEMVYTATYYPSLIENFDFDYEFLNSFFPSTPSYFSSFYYLPLFFSLPLSSSFNYLHPKETSVNTSIPKDVTVISDDLLKNFSSLQNYLSLDNKIKYDRYTIKKFSSAIDLELSTHFIPFIEKRHYHIIKDVDVNFMNLEYVTEKLRSFKKKKTEKGNNNVDEELNIKQNNSIYLKFIEDTYNQYLSTSSFHNSCDFLISFSQFLYYFCANNYNYFNINSDTNSEEFRSKNYNNKFKESEFNHSKPTNFENGSEEMKSKIRKLLSDCSFNFPSLFNKYIIFTLLKKFLFIFMLEFILLLFIIFNKF
jgi:hypothetical protein